MNAFDLIVLAILAALTLRGIWKGMISQIVSVASYFVCWIVATRFGSLVAPSIPVEAPWDQVLAMGIIFVITLVAIRFAAATLEKLIKDWHLDKLNKLLGGALGFVKGLLLCLIITFFAVMVSETSRAVVFNSMSGTHLAGLITRISVFVPKDSYEFVHSQLAQFQGKVDETVPGQPPETLRIQSSETMQQVLAQLQQTQETPETGPNSLWTALSKWWNSSKEDTPAETTTDGTAVTPLLSQTQPVQDRAPSSSSEPPPPAATYTSPILPQISNINVPQQPATSQPAMAVEPFFIQRAEPQLTALLPSAPAETSVPSLTALAPLTEALPILPETTHLLPTLPPQNHVGSDMLLRNSTRQTVPDAPARVFRP